MDINSNQKRSAEGEANVNEVKRIKQEENKNEVQVSTFDFKEKTWKEDIVLIVEEKRLYVTKAILAHASPVFESMFQANFKEKRLKEIPLPGKKVEDMQQFLRCIYPIPYDVTRENVTSIVSLAEEYQVTYLKSKCEACMLEIISCPVSSDELYNALEQASKYVMPILLKRCVEIASLGSIQSLHDAEKRMTIQPEVKCLILDKMVMRLEPKNVLEVVKNYYGNLIGKGERLEIKDYSNWDGSSLEFLAPVRQWKLCEITIHGTPVECSLYIDDLDHLVIKMKIKTGVNEHSKCIRIVGIVVIKPVANNFSYEDIIKKFTFVLSGSKEKEKAFSPHCTRLHINNGYICKDKFDVELHVLSKE